METDKKLLEIIEVALRDRKSDILFKVSNILEKRAHFESCLDHFESCLDELLSSLHKTYEK